MSVKKVLKYFKLYLTDKSKDMEENIKMNVTKEELEIIQFYRNLSEEKKEIFQEFIGSLKNMMQDFND